jgi:hypothetical protein
VKPVLLVIAGPHGAGKTTVTVQLRQDRWSHGVEYLNPDDIAQQRFGDWNSADAVLKAAQWTSARREELLAEGAGIAFETVFSTADKIGFVRRARKQGYFVRVFFVGTSDPRINAGRIAGRVMVALRVADRVYIYATPSTPCRRGSARARTRASCARSTVPCPTGSRTRSPTYRGIPTSSTSADQGDSRVSRPRVPARNSWMRTSLALCRSTTPPARRPPRRRAISVSSASAEAGVAGSL